jgi:hypothetical protein
LPTSGSCVGSNRLALPQASRHNGGEWYTLAHQVVPNCSGALIGETSVELIASYVICVSFDLQFQVGISKDDPRNSGKPLAGTRLQRRFSRVE